MLIGATRVLLPSGLVDDGWVEISDGVIVAAGSGAAPGPLDEVLDATVAPGFVDVHAHGGGGAEFGEGVAATRTVLATHRARGTTTMVASLVTGSLETMERQVGELTPLVTAGDLAGVHLEGPWLAPAYKGAHDPVLLRDPVATDIDRLLAAGSLGGARTSIRLVTIAPERAGGLDAVARLVAAGVVVAVGHTAADFTTAASAIEAGATGATHLFNAMPELLHRAPGPALALWRAPQVWVELVCDGVHVNAALVAHVMATKPDRCVLVTDSMAAAGSADGDYLLGGLPVEVRGGVARLTGTDTIAGSTLTLDRAVRVAIAAGVDPALALAAATSHPADYLGLTEVGRLAPGRFADLVVLDDSYEVVRVMRRGQWVA